MKAPRAVLGFILCLIVFSGSSIPLLASGNQANFDQRNENGNFIREPFAKADALRYSGLFGLFELMYDQHVMEWNSRRNIFARDMGFAVDEPHFVAITGQRSNS